MRLAGWLLNLAYALLLAAVSPLLGYRAIVHGKRAAGVKEKLWGAGAVRTSSRPCLWLHAVSVGEVLLLQPVVAALRRQFGDVDLWISTTTPTGHAVAREKFPNDQVLYYPLDFTWAVRRAIARVRPSVIALVELELWPNFIAEAHRSGIPLVLLNGRIGERSFRGYGRVRPLVRAMLRRFTLLTAQTDEYAERLRALGAPADRVCVTGSVKYDGLETDRRNPRTAALREAFGIAPQNRVFIAGSTQAPEEDLALETYRVLSQEFPDLRLVLVPRHRERFDEVAALVRAKGFGLVRRSAGDASPPAAGNRPVLLLDTLGELAACWGLADLAFVGGSLSRRGGQNMLEPAAYGTAVLFGPNTFNFRHPVELLLGRAAAAVVHSGDELTETVRRLLKSDAERLAMGRRARDLVLSQQGATERIVALMLTTLQAKDTRRRAA